MAGLQSQRREAPESWIFVGNAPIFVRIGDHGGDAAGLIWRWRLRQSLETIIMNSLITRAVTTAALLFTLPLLAPARLLQQRCVVDGDARSSGQCRRQFLVIGRELRGT